MMMAQCPHHFFLSGYLSPPTRVPPFTGIKYMIALFIKTQFEFETANKLGLEPGFPRQKAATLTIEPDFIDETSFSLKQMK